jgi:hypothetical protein
VSAGAVQVLTFEVEHPGDRILSEPVDLEVRVDGAQLARDG